MKQKRQIEAGAKSRRSACAAESRRAEIRRAAGLSVETRIRTALGMSRRFAALRPSPLEG